MNNLETAPFSLIQSLVTFTLNHCKTLKTLNKTTAKTLLPISTNSMAGGRFKELLKKYGKVALGVHFSVSAASITGLYIAIKNNVDVESIFAKWHLPGLSKSPEETSYSKPSDGFIIINENTDLNDGTTSSGSIKSTVVIEEEKNLKNRTAELAASTGGALALAVLCNKALFPVRVPITIALTPPLARFLARRRIIKNSV